MWRILSASLGAGRVSGHRMIGVFPDRDQRPGQQEHEHALGAERGAAAENGTWSFTVVGAGFGWFVRWHLTACGVMLAGQARLAAGSMRACHEVISDGEGLVQHWQVTQLTRLAIPGPLAQAQAGRVGWHQIARLGGAAVPRALAVRLVR